MKYRAVIFDLFGTLVVGYSRRDYDDTVSHMADAVRVQPDAFARLWRETGRQRTKDHLATPQAAIQHICGNVGAQPGPEAVDEAAQMRLDFLRRCLHVRRDAVETMSRLREKGFKIGLISNCSPEVPGLWREVPLAPLVGIAVFSSDEGLVKPDPQIYLLACERLGIGPQDCLYVGDGAGRELPGATRVGMDALRVDVESEDYYGDGGAEEWPGPAVATLGDVVGLVDV